MKRLVATLLLSAFCVVAAQNLSNSPASHDCRGHEHTAAGVESVAGAWYNGYCTKCGHWGHRATDHPSGNGSTGVRG